jgi:hypothetical protein
VDEQYHIQTGKRTLTSHKFLNLYGAPDGVLKNSHSTVRSGARVPRAAVLAADLKNNRRQPRRAQRSSTSKNHTRHTT